MSAREILMGCFMASVSRNRIAVASSNLIAKKKSESADSRAYFATTNPELQITMKSQGAIDMARFTARIAPLARPKILPST